MTAINPHLSAAELEQRYKAAGEPIAKSHFHALWLLSQGYDIDETAGILSFSPRWARILVKRYNEGGPELLGDQRAHNGTEPTILTPPNGDGRASDGCWQKRRTEAVSSRTAVVEPRSRAPLPPRCLYSLPTARFQCGNQP